MHVVWTSGEIMTVLVVFHRVEWKSPKYFNRKQDKKSNHLTKLNYSCVRPGTVVDINIFDHLRKELRNRDVIFMKNGDNIYL